MKPLSRFDVTARYGSIITDRTGSLSWPQAPKWLAFTHIRDEIAAVLKNGVTGHPVLAIYCNREIFEPLCEAFDNIVDRGLQHEMKTFDGCYNVRLERGSSTVLSSHCWGLAVDLNAALNPLGAKTTWSNEFLQCWRDANWLCGADFKRCDSMHFQWLAGP